MSQLERVFILDGKICCNYVGLACIDGTCPIANKLDYMERYILEVCNCIECYFDKGCEDCVMAGTYFCWKEV